MEMRHIIKTVVSPITLIAMVFSLILHSGGSGLRLNDDPDVKPKLVGLVPGACLRLGTPWLN